MPRDLTPFPLALAMEALTGGTPGARLITMAEGQWDGLLAGAYRARFHPVGAGQSGATGAGVPESEPLGGAVEMMEFFLASPLRRSLSARCPGFGSEAGSSRRCARRLSEARCRSLRTQLVRIRSRMHDTPTFST